MKIVALLTIRNEELYLDRCLTHLYQEGIEVCVIDNGSTDRSLEIAESFRGKNVIRIEHFPFHGYFELKSILQNEERLAGEIKADWFIHHDADEIRHAPAPFRTLAEGISEADKLGYNAINFDEFVFLPTDEQANYEGTDYVKTMRYYYFFELEPLHRVNAWKKLGMPINLADSGGHKVTFDGQHIFSTPFILRHYMVLSWTHAVAKHCDRVIGKKELALGWFAVRSLCSPEKLKFPSSSELKELSEANEWDRSHPWKKHTFLG